jgi:two-component system response regulator HupR/HoxA
MDEVCGALAQVAPFDVPVLLIGGSGTGKELAARAALRFAALEQVLRGGKLRRLPDELLESELFGHKKRRLYRRHRRSCRPVRAGRWRHGLSRRDRRGFAAFQVKLLRVLQEGEIRPLGHGARARSMCG